jgi:hypothetical protein
MARRTKTPWLQVPKTTLLRAVLVSVAGLAVLAIASWLYDADDTQRTPERAMVPSKEPFECEILQQNRFQYALPIGLFAAAILVGAAIGIGVKYFGLSRVAGTYGGMCIVFSVLAFLVWYAATTQGVVQIRDNTLIVRPKLRSEVRIRLDNVQYEHTKWERKIRAAGPFTVGPMVTVTDGRSKVSIGCVAPKLASELPRNETMLLLPPEFTVEPSAFCEIVGRLEIAARKESP